MPSVTSISGSVPGFYPLFTLLPQRDGGSIVINTLTKCPKSIYITLYFLIDDIHSITLHKIIFSKLKLQFLMTTSKKHFVIMINYYF